MSDLTSPRVFISYSHDSDEHCQRVLELAQELRRNGIDAIIDRFSPHPKEGWPRWMQHQMEDADFVLAVCTTIYKRRFDGREEQNKGHGVNWEGFLVTQLIYQNQALNNNVIPIVFEDTAEADIPLVLRGHTHYRLPTSLKSLLQRLIGSPEVPPAPLGEISHLHSTLPPLSDAPVQSAGVGVNVGKDAHDNHHTILDSLCAALEMKYREISQRYTPLEVRKDLRVCQWEPRFILRNPVKHQSEQKAEPITLDYVETVNSFHRLVILGEPGCGKSTGLYASAHKMAASRSEGSADCVPIIINLNRYTDFASRHPRDTLVEMVLDECNRALHAGQLRVQLATLDKDLRDGRLCVLFDGLNEVPATLRNNCIKSLVDFCDEFEQCRVTITSRKYMYNGELPYLAMEVLELGREDISSFVERHAKDGGLTADAILSAIDKTKWHLFQNPLALHMMIKVFQETKTVPDNRALLIQSYVEVVLDGYFSNLSRTGAWSVSKTDVKRGLTSIAELMGTHGLCLPSEQIEQHLRATGQEPGKASALTSVAHESGLLVREGGMSRFWHHSIQEYFFVLGVYSHWKGYLGEARAARSQILRMLRQIEKWETISLAAGLMTDEEKKVFLKECAAKDEYLTAMVLNHCGGIEPALLTQKKIINRARVVSLLSYWAGSLLEWEFGLRAIYLLLMVKLLMLETGYAFQKPSRVSLPLLGPAVTIYLFQLILCILVIMMLRRLSDYLVFSRLNTIIRALQHIGSPETRSELMKIFRKFSASARLELSYLTVIQRVVASNICTQDELFEGLGREEEKLYCLTTLANIADSTAMPVVCGVIHSEQNKYALEAAVDCVVSIANKFPQCKDHEQYKGALLHAAHNRKLSIKSRLKAYAHYIEASGTAEDIPYPTLTWLDRLGNALLSPRWATYYLMTALIAIILSQTNVMAVLAGLFTLRDFGNFSGKALLRLIVILVIAILIPYLLAKIDLRLQRRVMSRADRKWLSLGEATSVASRAVPMEKLRARKSEIQHETNNSIWRGDYVGGALQKVISYGMRHGCTVDYLQPDRVSLRMALRSHNTKVKVSPLYQMFLTLCWLFIMLNIYWNLTKTEITFRSLIVLICFQVVDLVFWVSINPYVSLVVSQREPELEVAGEVHLRTQRFPVSRAAEANRLMAQVIADIAGNSRSKSLAPVIQPDVQVWNNYTRDMEDLTWDISRLLEDLKLSGDSKDENDYIRAVADYLKNNSDWEIELSPRHSTGTPDILIDGQLALEFLANPDKTEREACIYRCASFHWATWIILIETPETVVESLKEQLSKRGLDQTLVWHFPLD